MSHPGHISVPDVVALLDADSQDQVFAAVPREDVLALLLLGDTTRQVLIVERHEGQWVLPELRSQTSWSYPTQRPQVTEEPRGVAQLGITQSASQGIVSPVTAWTAVTGVAARDAEIVSVQSDIDSYPTAVSADGIFLALLRVPWRSRHRITVVTHDGRRIKISPYGQAN